MQWTRPVPLPVGRCLEIVFVCETFPAMKESSSARWLRVGHSVALQKQQSYLLKFLMLQALRSSSSKPLARVKVKWILHVWRIPLSLSKHPGSVMIFRRSRPGFWRSQMCSSSTKRIVPAWKSQNARFAPRSSWLTRRNAYSAITDAQCQ